MIGLLLQFSLLYFATDSYVTMPMFHYLSGLLTFYPVSKGEGEGGHNVQTNIINWACPCPNCLSHTQTLLTVFLSEDNTERR